MNSASINDLELPQCELTQPFEGAWVADCTVITDLPVQSPVTIQILGQNYSGAVVTDPDSQKITAGVYAGQCYVRVVGGAGGLTRTVEPNANSYDYGATVEQVLTDLLGLVGETPAEDIDPALLVRELTQWSWTRGSADGAIGALADFLGVAWAIRADGKVWLGTYDPASNPAASFDYDLLDVDQRLSRAIITADTITVRPGQTFAGQAVREVLHQVRGGETRTVLTFDPGVDAPLRRLLQRSARRSGQDYSRPQPGKIAEQNADGSCKVQLDNDSYPPLRNVPIDLGLPDSSVKIQTGARVLVEWQGGLPTSPVITAWGQSTATEITIGASAIPAAQHTIRGETFLQALIDDLNADIISAYSGLPAAAPSEPLATAIRAALLSLVDSFNTFALTKDQYLTTIGKVG